MIVGFPIQNMVYAYRVIKVKIVQGNNLSPKYLKIFWNNGIPII